MIICSPCESVMRLPFLISFSKLMNHVHGIQYVLNSTLGTDWYISSSIVVIKPINNIKHLILFHEEHCTHTTIRLLFRQFHNYQLLLQIQLHLKHEVLSKQRYYTQ